MIDLDHFKQVNETHGHQAGDAVLEACADAITAAIRKNDYPAHWGGEEFIVLVHDADVDASLEIAERVRARIAEVEVNGVGVSASIGICTFPEVTAEQAPLFLEERISEADRALYVAKETGRDRVVHAAQVVYRST